MYIIFKSKSLMEVFMFKKMRRKEKQLTKNEARNILKNGEYGIFSTIGQDNYPYGVPINYVYYNDKIYLHCAKEGHKIDNIAYNNKVSFTVVGEYELQPKDFTSHYKSVVIFGKANFAKKDIKREALQQFILKYSPDFKSEGFEYIERALEKTKVIEINIDDIKGKKNT